MVNFIIFIKHLNSISLACLINRQIYSRYKVSKSIIVEIWCLTLYLFRRLGELTLIVPCYFGHSSVNLGYKIAL